MKICAMIAGSDRNLELYEDFFTKRVALLYYDFGIRKILCGVGRGTELEALNLILDRRQLYPAMKIDGVFTHEEEANHWRENEREMLYRVIARCDEELILKPVYGSEMRFQRNIVMMDIADLVLLIGDDTETEYWANRMMKPLLKLDPAKERMIPEIRLFRQKPLHPMAIMP
ncbi:MAG TPA: SLOG family protein [Clostridiales bacterium]|nr:SLOG family protein [Clostridiales bacterium]